MANTREPWKLSCSECQSIPSDYPCPIKDCSRHKEGKDIHWTHSDCGGSFRLYENGKEMCQKCFEEDYFCKWSYSCSANNKSQRMSYTKIRNILQKIVGMDFRDVSVWALWNIRVSIEKQCEDFPDRFDQ